MANFVLLVATKNGSYIEDPDKSYFSVAAEPLLRLKKDASAISDKNERIEIIFKEDKLIAKFQDGKCWVYPVFSNTKICTSF